MSLDRLGPAYQPYALSLFRFITGLLLFQYGIAKIFKFPVLPQFADVPPLIMTAGTLELVLGGALMIGLFTRTAAFILSGQMAVAYFLGHMLKTGEPVFLPLLNGGTPSDPVLLRLSLSGDIRRRTVERGGRDGEEERRFPSFRIRSIP